MVDYWFGYYKGEPRSLHRINKASDALTRAEYFDRAQKTWLPDDSIERYIYFGEIGYEQTDEKSAEEFISSLG